MTDQPSPRIRGIPPAAPMQADFDVSAAGYELLGARWQPPLAYMLGVNVRTVQRWANGRNAVPPAIAAHIRAILAIVRQCRADATADRARRAAESAESEQPIKPTGRLIYQLRKGG